MTRFQSLDDLIARKAVEFADQIRQAAAIADKEEEIRIEVERQLAFIEREAGVKLEGRHEFTVASGRVDSVYQRVIIEYKNPSSPSDRIGPKADSPGTKKVVEQIKKRFYDLRKEHGQPLNSLFGVGLDGYYFVFVRFRDDKWQVQDPVEVSKHSAERFLWALFNLGQKGKPFSPEYLAGDFGSEAKLAQDGIHALYEAIASAAHPKAQTFFSQWKILFGEVCGYDVENPSDKLRKLAEFYGVPLRGLKPAELLFAVHSYYALFMKLLASEIVAFFHKLPTPLQKMMQASTSAKLKREMEDLEAGSIFRHLNITNFLEGDLFAWYVPVWAEPIEKLVRAMVTKLDDYNPGTLSEDPAGSRDLLKKLYQQLFPKSVRHDLGEYYTPDWLAEHVLNELGYAGDPDKRILDPACGSGTFLVMAINRIRAWYDKNREKCAFGEDDLCRKILANVIGFDLNPLAVMAARTNYLIAIRDLIGRVDRVQIPVYLCDSILTPSTYGGLFAGTTTAAKELKTAAAKFLVPTEIATNPDDVAKYAEQLEACVRNGYSPKEFIERCQEEGLPVSAENLHTELYKELVRLDKANKNGVWARIIKNAFAPLFIGRVDFVAGNPPWVNWDAVPADYREPLVVLHQKVYGLFPHKGLKARLGSSETDLSILMLYTSADTYLSADGSLGFVITQSVFKTSAAEGFRKFNIRGATPLGVYRVDDMVALQPFEGASNRTGVIFLRKGTKTRYPVEYIQWTPATPEGAAAGAMARSLDDVIPAVRRVELSAQPVDPAKPTSPWICLPRPLLRVVAKAGGASRYKAHVGVHTFGANAVYWMTVDRGGERGVLVHNFIGDAKHKVDAVTASIEPDLIYPLLRGRDLDRWSAKPSLCILSPQQPDRPDRPIAQGFLKTHFPKTYMYLNRFRDFLSARVNYKKFLEPTGADFYALYSIKAYTYAPYKVGWRYIDSDFRSAVIGMADDDVLGPKPILPDTKVILVACRDAAEAHYLCALLNSSVSRLLVKAHTVSTQIAPNVLEHLAIPVFDRMSKLHAQLSSMSRVCHDAVASGDQGKVRMTEAMIDQVASELWGLAEQEMALVVDALACPGACGSADSEAGE